MRTVLAGLDAAHAVTAGGVDTAQPDRLVAVLSGYVSPIIARSVIRVALRRCNVSVERSRAALTPDIVDSIVGGLDLYVTDPARRADCSRELSALLETPAFEPHAFLLRNERDVVEARSFVRRMAAQIGFCHTDQIKVATAVSELARNAVSYAGGGEVRLAPLEHPRRGIRIDVQDSGPGITRLDSILAGTYRSKTGLGLGLVGCKRLMDEFEIETARGRGTRVTMAKVVP